MNESERLEQIKKTAEGLKETFKDSQMPEHGWYAMDVKFLLDQLDAEKKDNERLRERNQTLAPKAAIYQAQNKIIREALCYVAGYDSEVKQGFECDCAIEAITLCVQKASQALERIDKAMQAGSL